MVNRRGRVMVSLVAFGFAIAAQSATASASRRVACASDRLAVVADSVAAAFDRHQFVLLGSTHGGAKQHEFLLCLLSRPAFQERAIDVLVEWGSPVHQRLVDRYLLALEPVPEDSLALVWFDTPQPALWARLPQMAEFYHAVHGINTTLDPARRIRVLGGSDPVPWSTVQTPEDIAAHPYKTNWSAHVVTEHFAAAGRRLLVVYGEGHIHHHGGTLMADLRVTLARDELFVVGTVATLDAGESDRVSRLGDPSEPFFVHAADAPPAGPYPGDLFYADAGPLTTYLDAVVFLGPDPDRNLAGSIELTAAQRAEIARRRTVRGDGQQLMRLRYGRRDQWFRTHPRDIPDRPPDPGGG